jgi:predicted glutamine amidotransferase
MCLLMLQKGGHVIPKEHIEQAFKTNKDGLGFAYASDSVIKLHRFKTTKPFFKAYYKAVHANPDANFLVHLRFGTSGRKDDTNCHPFYVNPKLVFAHNGVIHSIADDPEKKLCDTRMFCELILKEVDKEFLSNEALCELILSYIGIGNKLAFLDNEGKYTIMNESVGHWNEGVWYSNMNYKSNTYKTRTYTPPKTSKTPHRSSAWYQNNRWNGTEFINRATGEVVLDDEGDEPYDNITPYSQGDLYDDNPAWGWGDIAGDHIGNNHEAGCPNEVKALAETNAVKPCKENTVLMRKAGSDFAWSCKHKIGKKIQCNHCGEPKGTLISLDWQGFMCSTMKDNTIEWQFEMLGLEEVDIYICEQCFTSLEYIMEGDLTSQVSRVMTKIYKNRYDIIPENMPTV